MVKEGNSVLQKSEQEANKFVAKVMRITGLLLTLILILNITGVFIIKMGAMVTAYVIGMIILLTPTLLVNVLKIDHPCLKYIFVTITILFVCIMIIALSWHAVLIYIFAIGIACLYFSKAVNIYACIASPIFFSLAQLLSYSWDLTNDANAVDLKYVIVYAIFPRALALLAMSSLLISINSRTRGLLSSLINADEQSKIMDQVKISQEKSYEVSQTLLSAVNTTSSNSEKVLSVSSSAAKASKETLDNLTDVSNNVVKISESLSQLSNDTDEITSISSNVKSMTKDNLKNMTEVMSGFNDISESTDQSKEAIKVLEEKSHEIESITNVITDISSKTNLLAINASIESARAGEAGKSFAVVANEIRDLAAQTGKAVNDISSIIKDVIINTNNASKSIDESSNLVASGKKLVARANDSSNKVSSSTDNMVFKIESINSLAQKVTEYSELISNIVTGAKQVSSNSMSELEKVTKASEEEMKTVEVLGQLVSDLNDISTSLKDMIK